MGNFVKSVEEINEKIRRGQAVVVTAEEVIPMVRELGPKAVAERVDVVTTATFGAMCSSGAFLNFGHSEPPIKMQRVWLNDVPAYTGVAAVDAYIGATELSESAGMTYGGAHVIEDLVSGKEILLKATSYGTDCYPRTRLMARITKDDINQAFLFNPRNAYQNYAAATNSSSRLLYTYMGILLPKFGNVNYCTAGQLSPLLNDPYLRTIGVGTRVWLAGAPGYVAWEGTQHFVRKERSPSGTPVGASATLALVGDLKLMNPRYLRAATFTNYGTTLFVGVGVPIPILDEDMARCVGISDADIETNIYDYGVPSRQRPVLARVTYAELKSGEVELSGKKVRTAPLSSYAMAREIAGKLKDVILKGEFTLTEPVAPLPARERLAGLEALPEDVA